MNKVTFSEIEAAARQCIADHAVTLFATQQQRSLDVNLWGRLVGTQLGVADVLGRPWRQHFRAWIRHIGLNTVEGMGHELYAASITSPEGFAELVESLSTRSAGMGRSSEGTP